MITLPRSPLNIRLLVFQVIVLILAPIWILKLAHYFTHPIPYLFDSPSLVPQQPTSTLKSLEQVNFAQTLINVLMFGVFFVQHIVMARLSFKIKSQKLWANFPIYQRLIYNFVSSVLLVIVLDNLSPQNYVLFTLPLWLCIPFMMIGLYFMVDSNLQMQGSLLLPYKFSQLFTMRQVQIKPNEYTKVQESGITIKGSYSMIRHPMQSGCILLLTFGNSLFTFEKVIMLTFLCGFIYIGVKMEQNRLLIKYQQYKHYMNSIQFRFIPYLF